LQLNNHCFKGEWKTSDKSSVLYAKAKEQICFTDKEVEIFFINNFFKGRKISKIKRIRKNSSRSSKR